MPVRHATTDSATALPSRLTALGVLLCVAATAAADRPGADAPAAVRDAWIDGQLQATYALSSVLAPFHIGTAVDQGVVTLSGAVGDDTERDLAATIAREIDGVSKVENGLKVDATAVPARPMEPVGDQRPTFRQRIEDATATAKVRSNLLSNGDTRRLSINVETRNGVVILSGTVPSLKEKMLAEMIARNTDGIDNVRNQLAINGQT